VAYIPYTVRKTLSRIIDKLSLVWRAVRNEGNIAVFLSLIVYRCIPDSLLCHVGNWMHYRILLGAGNWSETEVIGVWNEVSPYLGDIDISCFVVSFRRGVCRVLLVKPKGKKPLGRPSLRCANNFMVNLHVVECGGMDWIKLAAETYIWRALVKAIMNIRVPLNKENYLSSCKAISFWRRTVLHVVSK